MRIANIESTTIRVFTCAAENSWYLRQSTLLGQQTKTRCGLSHVRLL